MKKILSMILSLAMLLSVMAVMVSAEGSNPFTDVKESDYYYEPVLWAVENKVTTGTSETTFSPNDPCTRAQVVTFLWRSAGNPEPSSTDNPFKDVAESTYYYKAVLWAVEEGITNGTSETTFSPDDPCTRAQVVTFLWRADGATAPEKSDNPFKDVAAGEYYYNAVLWAVEKKITTGTSDTTFSPDETCIRAQIVTFLYRYMMGKSAELSIRFQPEDYHMSSSMETAEFLIQVSGGTAPYTFQWTIYYDDMTVEAEPVVSDSPIHVFRYVFSDYDFDEYSYITVGCDVEDAEGAMVNSSLARVCPNLLIAKQPTDYWMTEEEEVASFTVRVSGGAPAYKYEWFVCYDEEEIDVGTMVGEETYNTMSWGFRASDFDDCNEISVYCVITDSCGTQVQTERAYVHPSMPLTLLASPDDYQMEYSSEEIEFTVEVMGGTPAYTYEWFVSRDGVEECVSTYVTDDTWHTLVYTITDYDFDYAYTVEVYCVVTDEEGDFVTSAPAQVFPKD